MDYMNLIFSGLWIRLNSLHLPTSNMNTDSYLNLSWTKAVAREVLLCQPPPETPVEVPYGNIGQLQKYLGVRDPLPHQILDYILYYPQTCLRFQTSYKNLVTDGTTLSPDILELLNRCGEFAPFHTASLASFFETVWTASDLLTACQVEIGAPCF